MTRCYLSFKVDDGTEVMDAIFNRKEVSQTGPRKKGALKSYLPGPSLQIGTVVRVVGKLDEYKDVRSVLIDSISERSRFKALGALRILFLFRALSSKC